MRNEVVIEQGTHEYRSSIGLVRIHAPRDVYSSDLAKPFERFLEKIEKIERSGSHDTAESPAA